MSAKQKNVGLGIDLGTTNLIVYLENKGIIFNEPSVISFDRESGTTIAAGKDAHDMLGKVHDKISVIKPLKNGVISDMRAAKALVGYVLKKIENMTDKQLGNTSCVICCPSEVTNIERDVMMRLATDMGIDDVFIEEEIKAAALGAGLNIFETKGLMVVDIGGGTTDVGILSFGDIVLSRTIRQAGHYMDQQIAKFIKQDRSVEIGELTSERCKIELASLVDQPNVQELKYAGRDIVRGIPKWITVSTTDVKKVITPVFEEIVKLVSAVLKDTPPELSADVYRHGILLTGGGSMIKGLDKFISDKVNVPVKLASNPLTCVAEGTKYLLKNRGDYLVNPMQL